MLTVIAICLGACVGALSRWQLGLWLNPSTASAGLLPWGTLAANLIGGYLVGVCVWACSSNCPSSTRFGAWPWSPVFWGH